MDFVINDLLALMQAVADHAKMSPEYLSFKEIHSLMEKELKEKDKNKNVPFNEDYLYKQIYSELVKAKDKSASIGLNSGNINYIARYIGFSNYDQFLNHLKEPPHPSLKECVGDWYSYVRCNSGQPFILVSPVTVYNMGKDVFMKLKGKSRTFIGKLKFEGQCIYCLLESKEDKNLHLVFKWGFAKNPKVLQGVFSGMSSDGDPIAGREVLVLQKEKFGTLKNERLAIKNLLKSTSEEHRAIGTYFKDAEGNILKIGKTSTFDWGDLA